MADTAPNAVWPPPPNEADHPHDGPFGDGPATVGSGSRADGPSSYSASVPDGLCRKATMLRHPRVHVLAFAAIPTAGAAGSGITGAERLVPRPIYAKWADAYNKATGARVISVGGLGRRHQADQGQGVDFGASDMPLADERAGAGRADPVPHRHRRRRAGGRPQGVNPGQLAHRPGAGRHLPGQDRKWNDAAITALNRLNCRAYHRRCCAGGLGTVFTNRRPTPVEGPGWARTPPSNWPKRERQRSVSSYDAPARHDRLRQCRT